MEEVVAKRFYLTKNYVPVYYASAMTLEKFAAKSYFREDLSRVIFASDNYAFRRRLELADSSSQYEGASSLNLPFMNYYRTSDWEMDDRFAVKQTVLEGIGSMEQEFKVRAIPVKCTYSCTLYFDRDDDAHFAYDKMMFDTVPNDNWLYTIMAWKGVTVAVPVFIKIQNPVYTPDFNENTWLTTNRIFTIKVDMEVRSYIMNPPKQPKYDVTTPIENDDATWSISETVITDFMAGKGLSTEMTKTLTITNYFDDTAPLVIDFFTASTMTFPTNGEVGLTWEYTPRDEYVEVTRLTLEVSGRSPIELDPTALSYTLTGLTENSTYEATLRYYVSEGKTVVSTVTITTPDVAAIENKDIGDLIGSTW